MAMTGHRSRRSGERIGTGVLAGAAMLAAFSAVVAAFHNVAASLWICLLASLACLLFCVAAIFPNTGRALPWSATLSGKLLVMLIGTGFVLFPLALMGGAGVSSDPGQAPDSIPTFMTILSVPYSLMQLAGIQISLPDWVAATGQVGKQASELANWYAATLTIYAIVVPILLLFFAVDAFVNRASSLTLRLLCLERSMPYHRSHYEVLVFNGVNERSKSVALSAIDPDDGALTSPVIVFCNMGDAEQESSDTFVQTIRSDAAGHASVLFTPLSIEDVARRIPFVACRRCAVRYFLLADNQDLNVEQTIMVSDVLVRRSEERFLDTMRSSTHEGPQEITAAAAYLAKGTADNRDRLDSNVAGCVDRLRQASTRLSLFCLESNENNGLVFDNLTGRDNTGDLLELYPKAGGAAGAAALKEFERVQRTLFDLQLLNGAQEDVYDLLTEHPLFDALEPIRLVPHDGSAKVIRRDDDEASPDFLQNLTVLIVGCGDYGTQALKACFWMGRLAGVELRVVVVESKDARGKARRLLQEYPDMMRETIPAGHCSCRVDAATGSLKDTIPTIRFCEMDATSYDFERLVDGASVSSLAVAADATLREDGDPVVSRPPERLIDNDAHLYAVVCTGSSTDNLNIALSIRRRVEERRIRLRIRESTPLPSTPVIATAIKDEEVFRSVECLAKKGDDEADIYPFGSLVQLYSYRRLTGSPFQAMTLDLQALYSAVNKHRDGIGSSDPFGVSPQPRSTVRREFNSAEVKKLSNKTSARFAPYRVWMLGLYGASGTAWEDIASFADLDTLGTEAGDHAFELLEGAYLDALGLAGEHGVDAADVHDLVFGKVPSQRAPMGGQGENRVVDPHGTTMRDAYLRLQSAYPVLFAQASVEHARWCAFYRSEGWRDLAACASRPTDEIPARSRGEATWIDADDESRIQGERRCLFEVCGARERDGVLKPNGHQSGALKLHYYLCDSTSELIRRGVDCWDDPFPYDRNIVIQCLKAYFDRLIQEDGEV